MKVHIHANNWLVLKAETIEDGFKLGVLQENLKLAGINIPSSMGTLEIPLFNKPNKPKSK